MNVGELKRQLESVPDYYLVVNADTWVSPISFMETNMIYKDHEIYYKELTEELIKDGFSEEDVSNDGEDCIALWSE
jgi:hypothetical protein